VRKDAPNSLGFSAFVEGVRDSECTATERCGAGTVLGRQAAGATKAGREECWDLGDSECTATERCGAGIVLGRQAAGATKAGREGCWDLGDSECTATERCEAGTVLGRQAAGATEADFSYMGMGSLAWRVTYQQGY
jgi:hypothetical protein